MSQNYGITAMVSPYPPAYINQIKATIALFPKSWVLFSIYLICIVHIAIWHPVGEIFPNPGCTLIKNIQIMLINIMYIFLRSEALFSIFLLKLVYPRMYSRTARENFLIFPNPVEGFLPPPPSSDKVKVSI